VVPATSISEARRIRRAIGRKAILAGERDALPIPGFDLGNSPSQLLQTDLARRVVVLTTTNGSGAIGACRLARSVLAVALVNAAPVARHAAKVAVREIVIVCAGRNRGRAIAIDDLAGAGAFIATLLGLRRLQLSDGAWLALELFRNHRARLPKLLRGSEGGRHLISLGAGRDVTLCAGLSTIDTVPRLYKGAFVNAGSAAST
jgi:2-phosphosulfolactate phosphatase